MRFDGSREPLRSGAGTGRDGADALGVLGDGAAVNGDEQIFLGGDVVVEAGLAQPHAVGDVLHGGGVVALLPKQLQRRLQQLLVPAGGPFLRHRQPSRRGLSGAAPPPDRTNGRREFILFEHNNDCQYRRRVANTSERIKIKLKRNVRSMRAARGTTAWPGARGATAWPPTRPDAIGSPRFTGEPPPHACFSGRPSGWAIGS